MRKANNFGVMSRALLALAAVVVIVSSVTFATLQSQTATLRGNSIQTATASLQLSPNGNTYSSSVEGYAFSNLIPGGQAIPNSGYPIYLKNVGSTPLALHLSVANTLSNPDAVDLTKVRVILTPTSGGVPQNMLLSDLIGVGSNGGVSLTQATRITPGVSTAYLIQIQLEADAVSGPSASISNLDFNFGAVAVN